MSRLFLILAGLRNEIYFSFLKVLDINHFLRFLVSKLRIILNIFSHSYSILLDIDFLILFMLLFSTFFTSFYIFKQNFFIICKLNSAFLFIVRLSSLLNVKSICQCNLFSTFQCFLIAFEKLFISRNRLDI